MEEKSIKIIFNKLIADFINLCEEQQQPISKEFARYYIQLFSCSFHDGIDVLKPITHCRAHLFLKRAIEKYMNPLDPLLANIKLSYELKNNKLNNLNEVRVKYKKKLDEETDRFMHDILQYPETSNRQQLEQMIFKMSLFIVVSYSLGSPKNHVILDIVRSAINSVIIHSDIRNYVLKKKYNRLEYMQRLAATVCGIVIYNNQRNGGDDENMRQIFKDTEMACKNTREALQNEIKRITEYCQFAVKIMDHIVNIDVQQKKIYCQVPLQYSYKINNFTIFFFVCRRQLKKLYESFETTEHLITADIHKFRCMMDKVDDVLKYRTSIEAELIFPHFVHMSEIWNKLILYLNHLAELNKIREQIEKYITKCFEDNFYKIVNEVQAKHHASKHATEPSFHELFNLQSKRKCLTDLLSLPGYTKDYCGLTMILTGGLLVPSTVQKKLCENINLYFGFRNMEYAKYAERHIQSFLRTFNNTIFLSPDLILLFDLEDKVVKMNTEEFYETDLNKNTRDYSSQTEMVIENNLLPSNWINVTWNIWDYHRETIKLAELRKRQTISTQTLVTYGARTAINQTYNTREHLTSIPTEASTECDMN